MDAATASLSLLSRELSFHTLYHYQRAFLLAPSSVFKVQGRCLCLALSCGCVLGKWESYIFTFWVQGRLCLLSKFPRWENSPTVGVGTYAEHSEKGTISTVTVSTISLKCGLKLASFGPEMPRITIAHLHILQNTEMVDRDPLACSMLLPHTPLQFWDKTLTRSKPASTFCSNLFSSTSFYFYLLGQEKTKKQRQWGDPRLFDT